MTQAATETAILSQAVSPVIEPPEATIGQLGRSWYIINKNEASNGAEIRIYEDVGLFGVSARQFADDLEEIRAETIHVRLNTAGGEIFDGIAMYNALKAHPAKIVVHIDGLAASAGSVIAMSGDEIRVADSAFLMIHECNGGVMGEADDIRKYADVLDKLNDSLASIYQARAGKTRRYWRAKIAEESWFSAEEAKAEGLVDAIDAPAEKQANNRFDFKIYNRAPEAARKAWARPELNSAPEPPLRSEGDPVSITKESTNMADNPTQVAPAQTPAAASPSPQQPPIIAKSTMEALRETEIQGYRDQGYREGEQAGRTAEQTRLRSISEACPGKPQMALSAFLSGQTPEAVRLAFEEANRTDAEWQQRFEQERINNARQVALAAAGGHSGVSTLLSDDPGDIVEHLSPEEAKEKAENEWDRQPKVRKGFTEKANYVAYRKMELMGRVQISK